MPAYAVGWFVMAGGAAMLRLRIVHSHGNEMDGGLSIPPGGVGMASALELGGERLSEAQWRAAELCRITWHDHGWRLLNGNPTLVCALNGERVMVHEPMAVSVGDTLELGLLRFLVESEGGGNIAFAPVTAVRTRGAKKDQAPEFDLRDLAFVADSPHTGVLDDVFGMLDIAGAERRSLNDPLAELLGEQLPPPVTCQSGDFVPTMRVSTAHESQSDAATLLLADLHSQFVHVVRDPTQLTGRIDWDAPTDRGSEHASSLEDLNRAAAPFRMLLDIIQKPEGIDQVLDSFDLLLPITLTAEMEPDDVLHLFAPQLARRIKLAVPTLTRREHHDMSPDSHMDLKAFRPDHKAPL